MTEDTKDGRMTIRSAITKHVGGMDDVRYLVSADVRTLVEETGMSWTEAVMEIFWNNGIDLGDARSFLLDDIILELEKEAVENHGIKREHRRDIESPDDFF